jgi:hypothetical protein
MAMRTGRRGGTPGTVLRTSYSAAYFADATKAGKATKDLKVRGPGGEVPLRGSAGGDASAMRAGRGGGALGTALPT